MTRMNSMTAAAPTVTRPVGRRPVTRLVIRTRDRSSRTSSGRTAVSSSVTDAPGISRFDRGVAWQKVRPVDAGGQWHPWPPTGPSKVGRVRAPYPGRLYQVRGCTGPPSASRPTRDTLCRCPVPFAPASSRSPSSPCSVAAAATAAPTSPRSTRPDRAPPTAGSRAPTRISRRRCRRCTWARPADPRFGPQLHGGQPGRARVAGDHRGAVRRRDLDVRCRARRGPRDLHGRA